MAKKWSKKYKRSIDCNNPKGFSQKAHCAGRKKKENVMSSKLEELVGKPITEEQFDEAAGKKDACYHKVKARYDVWPSAYASGALVKCRKVGAKNWGNKSKKEGVNEQSWHKDFKGYSDKELKVISKFIMLNDKGIDGVIKMSKKKDFKPMIKKMAQKGLHEVVNEYTYGVGDIVKDINPTCPHNGAMGKVKSISPKSVVFVVMNKGKNYQPGDVLDKTHDQMEKIRESVNEDVYAIVDKFNQKKQDYDQVYFKDNNLNKVKKHMKKMGKKYGKMNLIKVKTNGKMSLVEAVSKSQAQEIMRQLGGRKFEMLMGVKSKGVGKDGLIIHIGRNPKKISHIIIDIDRGKDLYNLTFGKIFKYQFKVVKKLKGIYVDQLHDMIEKYTGLLTTFRKR